MGIRVIDAASNTVVTSMEAAEQAAIFVKKGFVVANKYMDSFEMDAELDRLKSEAKHLEELGKFQGNLAQTVEKLNAKIAELEAAS